MNIRERRSSIQMIHTNWWASSRNRISHWYQFKLNIQFLLSFNTLSFKYSFHFILQSTPFIFFDIDSTLSTFILLLSLIYPIQIWSIDLSIGWYLKWIHGNQFINNWLFNTRNIGLSVIIQTAGFISILISYLLPINTY